MILGELLPFDNNIIWNKQNHVLPALNPPQNIVKFILADQNLHQTCSAICIYQEFLYEVNILASIVGMSNAISIYSCRNCSLSILCYLRGTLNLKKMKQASLFSFLIRIQNRKHHCHLSQLFQNQSLNIGEIPFIKSLKIQFWNGHTMRHCEKTVDSGEALTIFCLTCISSNQGRC